MSRRLLLVLALGAALVGAPSRVSAASNTLLGAQVSPTSGTTATTFTFSVRYEGRFAATAITATAGALTVSLSRVAGTAADGTWRGSSRLPAGTWPVVFAAVAMQGNGVTLTGPTVTVQPDAAVTAVPSTASAAPSSRATMDAGIWDGGATATDSPPPAAAAESAAPAPVGGDAAPPPMPSETTPAAPAPAAGQAGSDQASTTGSPNARPGASMAARSSTDGDAPGRAPAASPAASPATTAARGAATDVGGIALILGLAGLALVAMSGSGLLIAAGRRRRSVSAAGPGLAEDAVTAVQRRTLRRAHVRLDEDPIVASLGLPDADGAAQRRARRAAKRRGVR